VPDPSIAPLASGTGSLVGYARVSTIDQNPELQLDALEHAGCTRVFVDHASGAKTSRPQLDAALEYLRAGDTLCVWRLDRLGRSLPHLIQTAGELADRDIALRSLTEQIDTSSAGGRLIFHVFGALAEFERALIQERTHAGLAAARARGRKGGRRTVMTPQRIAAARSMLAATDAEGRELHTYEDVAKAIGVSRSTVVRHCT
jgi:DNA invertase Pin-like site-specific DNA recombinase